ncbi:SGNH/GDSL hydrolase family protein [Rhodococcus sp. 3A]|nr:SGNH/GDSL hydrolase family protein [Rhodococcus sp. 3A]
MVGLTYRRFPLIVIMAALAVLWSDPALADPVPGSVRYVAMGDSRAAGPFLAPTSIRDGCFRSAEGYPVVVARTLHVAHFVNVSCSGARTENVTDTAQLTPSGPMPPQLDALRSDATLVTLSIGGNDIRWYSLVRSCYTDHPGLDANCRSDPAVAERMNAALSGLGPKVSATLAAITRKAPGATVFLVGHGGIFGSRGCWPNIPTSDADAAWISKFFVKFNRVLSEAALTNRARYVEIATAGAGHDACARPELATMVRRPPLTVFRTAAAPDHSRDGGDRVARRHLGDHEHGPPMTGPPRVATSFSNIGGA